MSSLDQVGGKPGQEEPERDPYRKLPDVDAPELTVAEELEHITPCESPTRGDSLSQTSSFPNVVDFSFIDPAALSGVPVCQVPEHSVENPYSSADGKHERPAPVREYVGEDGCEYSQPSKLPCGVDPNRESSLA